MMITTIMYPLCSRHVKNIFSFSQELNKEQILLKSFFLLQVTEKMANSSLYILESIFLASKKSGYRQFCRCLGGSVKVGHGVGTSVILLVFSLTVMKGLLGFQASHPSTAAFKAGSKKQH